MNRAIGVFGLLIALGSAPVLGAAPGPPSDWCPAPALQWSDAHPLSTSHLPDAYAKALEKRDMEGQRLALVGWWLQYAGEHDVSATLRGQIAEALEAYKGKNPLPWGAWKPTVRLNVMRIDLGAVEEGLEIALPCTTFDDSALAVAQFAYTLTLITVDDVKLRMPMVALQATKVYKQYFARLENGLPMWPQELFVNGLFRDEYQDLPSRFQWIFLRPEALAAMKFKGQTDSQVDVAIGIEPFGFIRYRDLETSKSWWGASPLVTISNDNGVGLGGILRFNNYILGAAHHKKGSTTLLYVGVDLYGILLKDQATNNARELTDKLAERVKSAAKKELSPTAP